MHLAAERVVYSWAMVAVVEDGFLLKPSKPYIPKRKILTEGMRQAGEVTRRPFRSGRRGLWMGLRHTRRMKLIIVRY